MRDLVVQTHISGAQTDAAGISALLKDGSTTYACHLRAEGNDSVEGTGLTDLSAAVLNPAPLSRDSLGLTFTSLCVKSSPRIDGQLWYGAGAVPTTVARITVTTPDGATSAAAVGHGAWVFRHLSPCAPFHTLPPVWVAAFDDRGHELIRVNVN